MIEYKDILIGISLFVNAIFIITAGFWWFEDDLLVTGIFLLLGIWNLSIAFDNMNESFRIDYKVRRLD